MNIYFVSLGCDKNLVDSEIMIGLLAENGFFITEEVKEADVIIVNTCGFLNDANKESVETILDLANYKQTGNLKALIAAGCMVSRYKEKVMEEIPEIDGVVGVADYENITSVVKSVLEKKKIALISESNAPLTEQLFLKRTLATPNYFAYLKISEGCDNTCTYCTIPAIRGKYRSRTMESLIEETKMLVTKGVKEVVLVAQDTSLYGSDIYGENKLHELIKQISLVEGIEWIRIFYAYPEHITLETIKEMASNDKVVKYLDMPIQHAADSVLKKMGRRSRNKELYEKIQLLRSHMPDISLRTTLIVGFPQESEEDFNDLIKFIKDIKFDKLGVFTYSKEDGTPAAKMSGQILQAVKKQRFKQIMLLQKEISENTLKSLVGKTFKVIVDGKLPDENVYVGRSYRDAYEVDGNVFFSCDKELISGDFCNVKIVKSGEYDLYGELV